LCSHWFERYNIEEDIWEKWSLKEKDNIIAPAILFNCASYAINDNNILIMGGKNEKNEA
jgi:hypothetical protein